MNFRTIRKGRDCKRDGHDTYYLAYPRKYDTFGNYGREASLSDSNEHASADDDDNEDINA